MTKDEFWAGVHRASKELEKWPDWKLRSVSGLAGDAADRILERRRKYPHSCLPFNPYIHHMQCDRLLGGVDCEP